MSDLYVFIEGGNLYINFKKAFSVTSMLTDYEIDNTSKSPSGITPNWSCLDIATDAPCID